MATVAVKPAKEPLALAKREGVFFVARAERTRPCLGRHRSWRQRRLGDLKCRFGRYGIRSESSLLPLARCREEGHGEAGNLWAHCPTSWCARPESTRGTP